MSSASASKLEELRARKAEREAAKQASLEALEIEALEQEEKLCAEGKKEGTDFKTHITTVGVFVVGKPAFLVAKKFAATDKPTVEDVIQFVGPCVLYPETMQARAVFQEHGGVAWALAGLCMKLYEAEAVARTGK